MGRRNYLPLTLSEVKEIVTALGFKRKRKVGSHAQYEREASGTRARSIVTVDEAIDQFDEFLLKSMIRQSNNDRKEFYGATKKTAKKAGVPLYVDRSTKETPREVAGNPVIDPVVE